MQKIEVSFRWNIDPKNHPTLSYGQAIKTKGVSLDKFLTSSSFDDKILELRCIEDEDKQGEMKRQLFPLISPHGYFGTRSIANKNIVKHSNLIFVDLDAKGNSSVEDWIACRDLIAALPFCYHASLSIRGNGVGALIKVEPIQGSDFDTIDKNHKKAFAWVEHYFWNEHFLTIDPQCKNLSRNKLITHSKEGILNLFASPMAIKEVPKPKYVKKAVPAREYHHTDENRLENLDKYVDACIKPNGYGEKNHHHILLNTAVKAASKGKWSRDEVFKSMLRYIEGRVNEQEIAAVVSFAFSKK